MGFQQALSGLNASNQQLNVIGNNVANSGTVGFKTAATQFADVFAASLSGGGATQVGIGTTVAAVAQQFTQGNITTTSNPLDLAVKGQGMFRLSSNGSITWSRNGQFNVDKNGYIVNAQGARLTGYLANANGLIVPSTPSDIQVNTSDLPPVATGQGTPATGLQVGMNIDSRATPPTTATAGTLTGNAAPGTLTIVAGIDALTVTINGVTHTVNIPAATYGSANALASAAQTVINAAYPTGAGATLTVNAGGDIVVTAQTPGIGSAVTVAGNGAANLLGAAPVAVAGGNVFNPNNPASYTSSTSATVYDTLGNAHVLAMFYVKTATPNNWELYTNLDGGAAAGPTTLTFTTSGALSTPANGVIAQSFPLTTGAVTNMNFNLDLTGSTQFGSIFGVNRISQDGYTSGRLSGLNVSADGTVQGRYSNGQTRNLAQVVLGNFPNPNGLISAGGNQWQETATSGQPLIGAPGSGSLGAIQSAAIEESNVDLTAELVNMITAQRTYQANAQTIKTEDQILQTLVNLR
jgi:flagellar hook protein FlgE